MPEKSRIFAPDGAGVFVCVNAGVATAAATARHKMKIRCVVMPNLPGLHPDLIGPLVVRKLISNRGATEWSVKCSTRSSGDETKQKIRNEPGSSWKAEAMGSG